MGLAGKTLARKKSVSWGQQQLPTDRRVPSFPRANVEEGRQPQGSDLGGGDAGSLQREGNRSEFKTALEQAGGREVKQLRKGENPGREQPAPSPFCPFLPLDLL